MTKLICDICNDPIKHASSRSFFVTRKSDAAGSMEDVCETIDLCLECELRLYKIAISSVNENSKYLLAALQNLKNMK